MPPSIVNSQPSVLSRDRLDQILSRIPELRIAVIGDFFLDKYLVTDPALSELSVETGLEARQIVQIRCSAGAAGTVTNNLAALGVGRIHAIGAIGDDGEGYELVRCLREVRVNTESLICSRSRFTPTYTKPMVRESVGEREMERLDIKNRAPLPDSLESEIIQSLSRLLEAKALDAVIVADQVQERNCGVVTDLLRGALSRLARENPDVVFLADSRVRIGDFAGLTMKPNKDEAAGAVDPQWRGEVGLDDAARFGLDLAGRNGREVFVTVGQEGILVCAGDSCTHVPAIPVQGPIDIVGAGDSAAAGIVCALCARASQEEAAATGNLCAAVTIRKLGTTGTASRDELRSLLGNLQLTIDN